MKQVQDLRCRAPQGGALRLPFAMDAFGGNWRFQTVLGCRGEGKRAVSGNGTLFVPDKYLISKSFFYYRQGARRGISAAGAPIRTDTPDFYATCTLCRVFVRISVAVFIQQTPHFRTVLSGINAAGFYTTGAARSYRFGQYKRGGFYTTSAARSYRFERYKRGGFYTTGAARSCRFEQYKRGGFYTTGAALSYRFERYKRGGFYTTNAALSYRFKQYKRGGFIYNKRRTFVPF